MSVVTTFSGSKIVKCYLSPDLIIQEIKIKGAKEVVSKIWSDHKKEEFVLSQIETGDAQWLEAAKLLYPGSDAGSAEDIGFAIAAALPNAPELVLKMIGNYFPLREVCTLPFIEGELEIEEKYLDRAEKALVSVKEPKLQEVRWECLKRIHYLQGLVLRAKEMEKAK